MMADMSTMAASPEDEKRPQQLASNGTVDDNSDAELTQSSRPRSTGHILLAVCAAIAIIIASCYIVFSAAQPPPELADVLDADCYALVESNERLRQLGFHNVTWPSRDCLTQIRSHLRSQATKRPPPREIRKQLMVRSPLLEASLFASLGVTVTLDLACTWCKLGGRFFILDRLHKWTIRLLPLFYLVVSAVALYRNDYVVPSARLPAAMLIGISARVLVQVLYQHFPRHTNYIGTGYVAAGLWALTQSPVAGADEMDLAFALTFALGGHVANRLIESLSPTEIKAETEEGAEDEKQKEKDAPAY